MLDFLQQPWPWYISGPLIGLMVPLLLFLDGKQFGLSINFRHVCAMCLPTSSDFFQYDWKKEIWNMMVMLGILLGGLFAHLFLTPSVAISVETTNDLMALGLQSPAGLGPAEIFSWSELLTLKGLVFICIGGFLVGFGTRYADGCTSGHAIMGLSMMNWPSLVAVCGFFVGGLFVTHFILPFLLRL